MRTCTPSVDPFETIRGPVAIAMQQVKLERYGHVFPYIYAFYCAFVVPRRTTAPPVELYLPAGDYITRGDGQIGSKAHEEVAGLFSRRIFGLRIQRVPWVPFCCPGLSFCRLFPVRSPRLRFSLFVPLNM